MASDKRLWLKNYVCKNKAIKENLLESSKSILFCKFF